jgi:hypothetical protein
MADKTKDLETRLAAIEEKLAHEEDEYLKYITEIAQQTIIVKPGAILIWQSGSPKEPLPPR